MASRWTTALVDPPIAASATIALRNDAAGQDRARPPVRGDQLDGQPAGLVRGLQQPAVGGRGARRCRAAVMPSASASRRHRRGGAHRVAVPAAADHRRLGPQELRRATACPARTSSRQPPHVGAAAQRHAAEGAGEHRAAGDDDGGQVDRRGRHEQRRDRLVAAAEQHHPVDRVGPQHLLDRPSRPGCARASRSAGPASRRATPPAGSAGCRRPRRRPSRTAAGDLVEVRVARASGRRRCWRWRSAAGRRTRRPGSAAAHPGPVDVGVAVRRRRTTARCGGPRPPSSTRPRRSGQAVAAGDLARARPGWASASGRRSPGRRRPGRRSARSRASTRSCPAGSSARSRARRRRRRSRRTARAARRGEGDAVVVVGGGDAVLGDQQRDVRQHRGGVGGPPRRAPRDGAPCRGRGSAGPAAAAISPSGPNRCAV